MVATFSDISEIRLQISDPSNAISFVQVADSLSLPASPQPQTVYNVLSTGLYMKTEKTSGAVPSDYLPIDLQVSDTSISLWFNQFGKAKAIDSSIRRIMAQLGPKLQLARMANGSDSYDYTSLRDLYDYYKNMLTIFKEEDQIQGNNSTGRVGKARCVVVSGGLE